MKRFHYPMDPLLQYRDHCLAEARAELARTLLAEREAQQALADLRTANCELLQALAVPPADPRDIIWCRRQGERQLQNLARRITLQSGQCARAARLVEAARQGVVKARQELEQLTRHREATHEEWAQNLRRQMNNQMDELASQRHHQAS